jgi:phage prohead protease, HK97 family
VKHKSLVVDVSATSETGVFTGYASVFNNVDSVRDVVLPGAFTETLQSYGENGANIPCYWNHVLDDPRMCIGWTLEAREDANGLFVRVQLDLGSEVGAQAYAMLKRGLVKQMSITYIVEDAEEATGSDGGGVWHLKKLKLFEVSVVPVAANQEAEILDVKAGEAPRRARPSNDIEDDEKPLDSESGSEEEPAAVNSEEPETVKEEEPEPVNSRVLALAAEVELATIRLSVSEVIS